MKENVCILQIAAEYQCRTVLPDIADHVAGRGRTEPHAISRRQIDLSYRVAIRSDLSRRLMVHFDPLVAQSEGPLLKASEASLEEANPRRHEEKDHESGANTPRIKLPPRNGPQAGDPEDGQETDPASASPPVGLSVLVVKILRVDEGPGR